LPVVVVLVVVVLVVIGLRRGRKPSQPRMMIRISWQERQELLLLVERYCVEEAWYDSVVSRVWVVKCIVDCGVFYLVAADM
jgi:hypothetical protein